MNISVKIGLASAFIAVVIETLFFHNQLTVQNVLINFTSSTLASWVIMKWLKR